MRKGPVIALVFAYSVFLAVNGICAEMILSEPFDSSELYSVADGMLVVKGESLVDISDVTDEFVVELEAFISGNDEKRLISLKDDAKRRIDLVTYSGGRLGFLGSSVYKCAPEEVLKIAMAVNLKTKNAELFIDGNKIASRKINRKFYSYDAITHLSFKSSGGILKVDNLKIYSGNELVDDASFEALGGITGASGKIEKHADVLVMFDDSSKALSFGIKTDIADGTMPFERNGVHYVPLGFVMSAMGCEVYETDNELKTEGNIKLNFSVADSAFMLNGEVCMFSENPILKNGKIYVSDKDIAVITGMDCETAYYGTVVGNSDKVKELVFDEGEMNELFREVVFKVPSTDELVSDVRSSRPRVMADETTFTKLHHYIESGDERANKWLKSTLKIADGALDLSDVRYVKSDGLRLDNNDDLGRINELSFAYKVTGNSAYADKAWRQIEKICEFPDWNSNAHFLDTSGIMQSMAICYDWMYDYFTPKQKEIMLAAIMDKGLKPALEQYTTGAFWVKAEHNWNGVCNAGAAKLAIAVIDEPGMQKLASEVLRESLDSIRYMMGSFRPDGAWVEGAGYWYYMTRSLVQYMWTLHCAYGSTFGIAEAPGMSETGYFPAYMVGPNGIFNISEGGAYTYIDAPELAWFANYLGDEGLRSLRYDTMEQYGFNGSMIDLLLYNPIDETGTNALETDKYYRVIEATIIQSGWNDLNGVYFGLAGGSNGYNHGHMDAGMFTFDANGVRWAIGLDGDDYNLPGYFAQGEGGQTWEYYRLRAEGHNTLVIDPDSSGGQRVSTNVTSPIIRFETNENGGISVTDLTRNYDKMTGEEIAKSIIRGAKVDKNTGMITIQDEIELNSKEDIYWFMHTEAEIEISDNGKTAHLFKDGKVCEVKLASPSNAKFTVMEAKPLPSSPDPEGQAKNEEFRKLTIRLDDVKQTLISVIFNPYGVHNASNSLEKIEQWNLESFCRVKPSISALYADGEAVADFNAEHMSYDYIMKRDSDGNAIVPELSCPEAVEIIYPSTYPGTAYIVLADSSRYCVNISDKIIAPKEPVSLPENAVKLDVATAKAEAEQAGNEAVGAIDRDIDTRWSGEGNVSITFELKETRNVDYARFSFYKGDERYNVFTIDTSEDGRTWKTVFEGQSIEETADFQAVKLIPTRARYIRYNGKGTTNGSWNSINEAEFYYVPSE